MSMSQEVFEAAITALSKASGYQAGEYGKSLSALSIASGRASCITGTNEGDLKAVAKSLGFTAVVAEAIKAAGGSSDFLLEQEKPKDEPALPPAPVREPYRIEHADGSVQVGFK